jgi:uncharacterized membrane protein YfcA
MLEFIIAFIIIVFASMIQGISGFGFSLLAVPLLAIVMSLDLIVPILVIFSLLLNIIVFTKVKGHINKKQILILVVFGLSSIPIGITALKGINEDYIKLVVGIIIVVSAIAMQLNYKIKFKSQNLAYALTGFLSGVLNGASSLSGPPVILMLSNEGVDKAAFRKTLATYFLVLNLFSIPMFAMSGVIDGLVIEHSLKLLPAMLIGTFTGVSIGNKIPESLFRKFSLLLIFIMGVLTIVSAL